MGSGLPGLWRFELFLSHPGPAQRLVDAALPTFARGAESFDDILIKAKRHLLLCGRLLRATLTALSYKLGEVRKVAQRTHVPKVFGRQFADFALCIS